MKYFAAALPGWLTLISMMGGSASAHAAPQGAPYSNAIHLTGGAPTKMSRADVNGDGLLDIVAVTEQPNGVSVLLTLVTGGFLPVASYGAGTSPKDIAIDDVNNDGALDVLAADVSTNSVKVLKGTGSGAFLPATSFAATGPCAAIAVGEFNGDGKRDVVTGNTATNNLTVLTGSGTGAFSNPKTIAAMGAVNQVAAADLDGDGDGDLCYSIQTSSWVWVLTNGGHSNFVQSAQVATGPTPAGIGLADLNLDGRLDLAVNATLGAPPTAIAVALGSVTGFQSTQFVPGVAGASTGIDIRDVNSDGLPDLVVCPPGRVAVHFGHGAGTFFSSTSTSTQLSANDVVAIDVTVDNVLDAVLLSKNAGGLLVAKGKVTGGFEEFPMYLTGSSSSRAVAAGDFDHDGAPDLAVANYSGSVSILHGVGDGSYPTAVLYAPGDSVNDVGLADFNHDGNLDIAAVCETGALQGVVLMLGDGGGGFVMQPSSLVAQFPWTGLVGDFNEDGHSDFLTLNVGTNDLAMLLGDGAGSFSSTVKFPTGTIFGRSLTRGDWNSDGHTDIAIGSPMDWNLRLLLGDGLGSLGVAATLNAMTSCAGVASEDIDADGLDDLIVTGSVGVQCLKGNGAVGFTPTPVPSFPAGLTFTALSDIDGNGFVDFLASKPEIVAVALAELPGLFAPLTVHAAVAGTISSFTLHDVNLDGRQDVIVTPLYGGTVTVLANQFGLPSAAQFHGQGTSGCRGQAVVNASGDPKVGNLAFGLTTSNAPPHSLGLVLVGNVQLPVAADSLNLGLDLVVDVFGSTELIAFDSVSDVSGVGYSLTSIPFNPVLVGNVYVAQSIWVEPVIAQCSQALAGLVSSNGFVFSILP